MATLILEEHEVDDFMEAILLQKMSPLLPTVTILVMAPEDKDREGRTFYVELTYGGNKHK